MGKTITSLHILDCDYLTIKRALSNMDLSKNLFENKSSIADCEGIFEPEVIDKIVKIMSTLRKIVQIHPEYLCYTTGENISIYSQCFNESNIVYYAKNLSQKSHNIILAYNCCDSDYLNIIIMKDGGVISKISYGLLERYYPASEAHNDYSVLVDILHLSQSDKKLLLKLDDCNDIEEIFTQLSQITKLPFNYSINDVCLKKYKTIRLNKMKGY